MAGRKENRPLTVQEQVQVLGLIWDQNHDGYVFLPWIKGDCKDKPERIKNYHEGRAFKWPEETNSIEQHLSDHADDDVYFCPMVFNGKRRIENLADVENTLWADLDEVDPRQLGGYRPTIAWETSPGRYQAIWMMTGMNVGASLPGGTNQRLTYHLGADRGGWDTTQLLRVPGRPNHKPQYRDEGTGEPAQGIILWANGERFKWSAFDDLPEIGQVVGGDELDLLDEQLLDGIDRGKVWKKVRLKCSKKVREYVAYRGKDVDGVDRSDVLWQIERDLADAGCSLAEIIAIVRPLVWNKFKGRNNELQQLKIEASRALAECAESGEVLEVVDDGDYPDSLKTYAQVARESVQRVDWLIQDILPRGSCAFMAADAKHFKSRIALDMMTSLVTGEKFLGKFSVMAKNSKVLYVSEEDNGAMVSMRLDEVWDEKAPEAHPFGQMTVEMRNGRKGVYWAPPSELPLYVLAREGFVASSESWQAKLSEYIEQYSLDLVVIDTLFATAGDMDVDRGTEVMNKMLGPLRQLVQMHNCTVLILHHNRKSRNGETVPGKDMMGSGALHAWVEAGIYIRSKVQVPHLTRLDMDGRPDGTQIPGYEVQIHVESKSNPERNYVLSIPEIRRRFVQRGAVAQTPGMIVTWQPLVSDAVFEDDSNGSSNTTRYNNGTRENGGRRHTTNGGGQRNGRGMNGQVEKIFVPAIVRQLKECGATKPDRGLTQGVLAERTGKSRSTVSRQLTEAIGKGQIQMKDNVYWMTVLS